MRLVRQTTGLVQLGWVGMVVLLLLGWGCHKKQLELNLAPVEEAAPQAVLESSDAYGGSLDRVRDSSSATAPAEQRMIFYDGYVKLRSVKPDETIDAAARLAVAVDGYVEQMRPGYIILRIPVAKFDEIYKAVLRLADVLEKSVSARDVTESFQDVALRLTTAVTARDRLVELLSQSKVEKEKIRLLKEIQRLNDQIESLENLKTMLATMAEFSKITIRVEQRKLVSGRTDPEEIAAFKWISSLSPLKREAGKDSVRLNFVVPKDMVALDRKGMFIAEGADGAVFWSTTRDNLPEGDVGFWIEAIQFRIGPEFSSVSTLKSGDFNLLRLVENTEAPYVYWIGVKVEKKRLDIVQVYFPTQAQEKRYGTGILDSIAGGVQ